jgi:MarR family transcriptional regulator, organic hydroperoxide resistance regulator
VATAQRSPAEPSDQDGLVDALVQTSFVTMAVLNKVGTEHDLSLTQLRVLAILSDRRLKMAELAAYLGLDKSTMSGLVARAEKRDLLVRAPNPDDGRAVDVFLTRAGRTLARRLHAQVATALAPVTDPLTRTDQRRLRTLLEQLLGRPA